MGTGRIEVRRAVTFDRWLMGAAEDLLRLPTLRATSVDELDDGSYLVHAQIPKAVAFCTHCGSSQPYGHGVQEQRVVDVPNHCAGRAGRRGCRRIALATSATRWCLGSANVDMRPRR